MVQQLSLVSSIDEDSLEIFLTTISSLSGTPHISFENINLIYKPSDINENVLDNIDIQSESDKQQNRIKLSTVNDNFKFSELLVNPSLGWSISTSDIPLAGNNNKDISSQTINETLVSETESGIKTFIESLSYSYEYSYKTKGYRIFHPSMMISCDIFKVFQLSLDDNYDITTENDITRGGYMIKCYCNIEQAIDIENIKIATNNLINFKKMLQKYIDLKIPERKVMDSRIKDY